MEKCGILDIGPWNRLGHEGEIWGRGEKTETRGRGRREAKKLIVTSKQDKM